MLGIAPKEKYIFTKQILIFTIADEMDFTSCYQDWISLEYHCSSSSTIREMSVNKFHETFTSAKRTSTMAQQQLVIRKFFVMIG